MINPRTYYGSPARIPALGFRAVALAALAILLMILDHRDNHLDAARQAIDAAVYPLRVVVAAPFNLVDWVRQESRSRSSLQTKLTELETEQLLTNARLQKLTALEAENARLRAMLDAREHVRDTVRVAEIMAVDANPYRHNIVIDIGSHDGVYNGQAIVDANGVVGQVIDAGILTSQAVLISDPGTALPVEVNRNGLRTIAVGTGEFSRLDLPFLPNNADIETGDMLVTSGLGGAFPAGYPVAIVTDVSRKPEKPFAEITARPAAALDQVREVLLIWSAQTAHGNKTADSGEKQ